ncbi:IQ and ubiquitin-like domain-containing, partial [Brachionus plicatilis]
MSEEKDLKEINTSARPQIDAETSTNIQNQPKNEDQNNSSSKEPNATVKFLLFPINQIVTFAYPISIQVKDLKEKISAELKMEPNNLKFSLPNEKQTLLDEDLKKLSEYGAEENGIFQIKVESVDQETFPLKPYEPKENFQSPDVITVQVDLGNDQLKEIIVEIERASNRKPFLGGYRNRQTSLEYLNASTQTKRPQKLDTGVQKLCRDTQTIVSNHVKLQTRQDMSTQMTKPGVFISRIEDRLLTPKPYQTAEQRLVIIEKNVIIIQKYFRRWLAKRKFTSLKLAFEQRIKWEKDKENQRVKDIESRRQNDINRRLKPRTRDDFEILYAALEKWRSEEIEKINATKTGAARKAALAMLVDQEAELIATIERYKIEANKENKDRNIQILLEKMSQPKIWKAKNGSVTELDTPYNIRARELKDIFNSLNMNFLTQDERLDVLLTLKHTVKEHDCKLTQEIIALIDREADLLMRGIKEENLVGLRKRIVSLFLQYIKSPQFNPAAARHLKVPQDINEKIESFYCSTCQRYLPSTEFQISSSSSKVGKCRSCRNLENLALKRVDFTKFKFMLARIQQDEQSYSSNSRICFLLTERDIQYMFETIWNSQSILSSNNDIYQLHFVRWKKEEEWS